MDVAVKLLEGVRVLDVSRGIAGNFAARQMADLGADVVLVEPPGGHPSRETGPVPGDTPDPEASGTFLYLNLGKRAVTLDLDYLSGRNLFRQLSAAAQAVITDMIGQSREILDVMQVVEMVSRSDAPVFIQGESGTGKELVATAVHRRSDRADRPFLQLNCAAIPENLMESTLFGHIQGSFTGASKTTKGIFEEADGGTLLLDEISEISPGMQAKLLRVLQEQRFTKVGSHKPIDVNVRIVATSNRDIKALVREGQFREDLFYRLNVVPILVPPLRDRKDDIPILLDHFLDLFCRKYGQPKKTISTDTRRQLEHYSWPGNVREMKNSTERAILFAGDLPQLEMEHFFPSSSRETSSLASDFTGSNTIAEVEKQAILATLEGTGNNRTQAARILDISVKTLRNKLKSYEIDGSTN
ncbi:MAG: sigma 54-interacting transcriptional regulator [Candidatus Marinimicrobia bacterium]|nr:sigma 54-interacting transcriptional regulator [Candidatus Neomarinimicrobiota bacterium]